VIAEAIIAGEAGAFSPHFEAEGEFASKTDRENHDMRKK